MKHVLVVEDNEDIRNLISRTLESNFKVHQAGDGQEALRLLRLVHPFVALLDVTLPGEVDGFQVLAEIKTSSSLRDIKVALVTARSRSRSIEIGEKYGADGYFVKPFNPRSILDWVLEKSALLDVESG